PSQVPGKEKQLQHEIDKFKKIGFVENLDVYVVDYDELEKNPNAVLNRIKNNKYIVYVEPNYLVECDYIPNDPAYASMQSSCLSLINAPAGWDITKGAGSPVVAIVDSGAITHPDLPNLLNGYSAVSGLSPTNDKVGHGTNVAGTVGAIGDNKVGVVGINWNAKILPVKVDDATGVLTTANVAKGIIWAADNGAKVINLSLGQTTDSATLKSAIDYAYNKGCAIFAATGNNSTNSIHYPARYANVMAVGGTLSTGAARASTSNYGTGIDVVAVGAYFSTSSSGSYATSSGTSFASPQAAGLASLMWAVDPSLTNAQVYDLIRQNAKPLGGGFNSETGYGLIDIGKTLEVVAARVGGVPTTPAMPPEILPPPPPPEPKPAPTITLAGFSEVTFFAGGSYAEDGYSAADYTGKNITGKVKVTDNINRWTAGLYTVSYTVTDDYGRTASATRTVIVEPAPAPPPPEVPTVTVNGSGVIILHVGGTEYTEQGARAIDYDGENISGQVTASGVPDTANPGNYTVTYQVVGKSGEVASASRTVRVIAPTEVVERKPYSFSSQAKQGAVVTHTNITSDQSGWMDLKVTSLDKNMTIIAEFIDSATKQVIVKDTFSAAGMKQYQIEDGRYELKVTIDKANGNSKYDISLLMPENSVVTFEEEEVPLAFYPEAETDRMPLTIALFLAAILTSAFMTMWLVRKRREDSDFASWK
ncbi:MAG: S8 family serine peptidase, partial [Clostridiales bacterium]|nr:S8 family serine peptidase [Clostridiales bacterium]